MNRRAMTLALAGSLAAAISAFTVSAQAAGMDTGMQTHMKPAATHCDGMKDCKDDGMKAGCPASAMQQKSGDKMGTDKMNGSAGSHTDCGDTMMHNGNDSPMPMKDPN